MFTSSIATVEFTPILLRVYWSILLSAVFALTVKEPSSFCIIGKILDRGGIFFENMHIRNACHK